VYQEEYELIALAVISGNGVHFVAHVKLPLCMSSDLTVTVLFSTMTEMTEKHF
jgi:hypothetical protein